MATLKIISHFGDSEGHIASAANQTEQFITPPETFNAMISNDSATAIKTATILENFGKGITNLTYNRYRYCQVTQVTSANAILAE